MLLGHLNSSPNDEYLQSKSLKKDLLLTKVNKYRQAEVHRSK